MPDLAEKYGLKRPEPVAGGDLKAKYETASRVELAPGEDWTNPIQETHPKIGRLGRIGLKTFADAGPETMQRAIEQRYGLEARPLGNMRFAVKAPEEKEWRTVDPGWSMKQPLEPLYDVADVLPSWALLGLGYLKGGAEGAATGTALGGPVGGVVGGALGSAAGSAAAEEVKQELGGMLGYQVDPGEQARKVATEALTGGAARLLEPVFGLGIKGGEAGIRALVRSRLGQRVLSRGARETAEQTAARQGGLRDLMELSGNLREAEARAGTEGPGKLTQGGRRGVEISGSTEPRPAQSETERLLAEWEARGPAQPIEQLPERRAVPRPEGEKALTTEERLRLLKGRLETAGKDVEELSAFNQGTKQLGEVGSLKTGLGEKQPGAAGTPRREVVDQWDEGAKKFRHWLMEEQPGGQMKRIAETDAQGIPIKYDVSVGGQKFLVEPGAAPAIPPSQAAPTGAMVEDFAAKTAKEAAERLRWKGYGGLAGGAPPTAREMERVIMETLQNPAEHVRQLEEIFKRGLIDPVEEEQKPAFAALLRAGVDIDDARRMVMEYDLPRPPAGGGVAGPMEAGAAGLGPEETLAATLREKGPGGPQTPPEAPVPSGPPQGPPGAGTGMQPGGGGQEGKLRILGRLARGLGGGAVRGAGGLMELPARGMKRGIEAIAEAIPRAKGSRLMLREQREFSREGITDLAKWLQEVAPEKEVRAAAAEVLDMVSRPALRTSELRKAGESLQNALQALGDRNLAEHARNIISGLPSLPEGAKFLGIPVTAAPELELGRTIMGLGPTPTIPSGIAATAGAVGLGGKVVRTIGLKLMGDLSGESLRQIMRSAPADVQALLGPALRKIDNPSGYRAAIWTALHAPSVRRYFDSIGAESGNNPQ